MTDKKHSVKMIREGDYIAEVRVELIVDETGWSPYLSVGDAERLDEVRDALRKGNIGKAGRIASVFKIMPIAA
ncbi:MAG: hypothetical protein BWK80_20645 [Desulfobacteraceae bacterium IS3]|jgi:hypothetical protein|nr:MAG: hypothetical protein BWK80_20645 [Desulfobacteraceae bacterium IS3]HAO21464.1 hypothetical protein [Desulfobacteraceae bacterium]